MSALLVALLAGVADPGAGEGSKARLLNLQTIITADDYPVEALRSGQEGTVVVRLTVSPSGTISSCTVTQSSGSPALDERTCAIYRERAKFEPATDASGQAIESQFIQRTRWKLAESGPLLMPRTAWTTRFTLAHAADGTAVDCTIEASGIPLMPSHCEIPEGMVPTGGPTKKPVGFSMTETRFYPVDPSFAPAVPDVERATMVAKQVTRITITPDGQVIACEGIEHSGELATLQYSCRPGGQPRFAAALEGDGPMVGTLVQTAYMLGAAGSEPDQGDGAPNP